MASHLHSVPKGKLHTKVPFANRHLSKTWQTQSMDSPQATNFQLRPFSFFSSLMWKNEKMNWGQNMCLQLLIRLEKKRKHKEYYSMSQAIVLYKVVFFLFHSWLAFPKKSHPFWSPSLSLSLHLKASCREEERRELQSKWSTEKRWLFLFLQAWNWWKAWLVSTDIPFPLRQQLLFFLRIETQSRISSLTSLFHWNSREVPWDVKTFNFSCEKQESQKKDKETFSFMLLLILLFYLPFLCKSRVDSRIYNFVVVVVNMIFPCLNRISLLFHRTSDHIELSIFLFSVCLWYVVWIRTSDVNLILNHWHSSNTIYLLHPVNFWFLKYTNTSLSLRRMF